MTRLFLIRHGQTALNKQRRYCGYRDVCLNIQGKVEVAKLRRRLGGLIFDKIYCSDRKRAQQSASILFGNGFKKVKGLREINFGIFEGLKHSEILKKYPDIYKKWLDDPYKVKIPKAEPMRVFKKRVLAAIKDIFRANRGKTVAAVCHGGVIGVFVSNLSKDRNFWRFVPACASVTIVEHKGNNFKINKFNCKTKISNG